MNKKELEGQTSLDDYFNDTLAKKTSDNKDNKVMVRMDSDLKTLLGRFSKKRNESPSEYIRDAIIEKIVNEININELLESKKEYEEKYINLIKVLQSKSKEDFFDKTEHYLQYDEIEETIRLYNLIIKWYYEKVLQK